MNDQQKIEQLEHTIQQLEGRIKILTLANSKQHERSKTISRYTQDTPLCRITHPQHPSIHPVQSK